MLSPTIFLQLAATALLVSAQGPRPAGGCTTNSFTIPSWLVQDLKYQPGSAKASFSILNRPTNTSTDATCQVNKDGWSSCVTGDESFLAQIRVQDTLATVSVNQTWSCNDRNEANP